MPVLYVNIDNGEFLPEPDMSVNYCMFIEDDEDLVLMMPELEAFFAKSRYLGFDIETSHKDGSDIKRGDGIGWATDVLSCISVSDGVTTYVIKTSHMTRSVCRPMVEALMKRPLIGHNIKFDIRFINRDYGIIPQIIYDTEIAARTANMVKDQRYRLLDVMAEYLKIGLSKEMQISNWGSRLITGEQIAYCARDTFYLPQLIPLLTNRMDLDKSNWSTNKKSVYTEVFNVHNKVFHLEMEVIKIFAELEQHGVYVNLDKIKDLLIMVRRKEHDKVMRFINALGYKVNPRAPAKVLAAIHKAYPNEGYVNYKGEKILVSAIEGTAQDDIKAYVDQGLEVIDALYDYRTIMNRIQRLEEFYEAAGESDWRIRTSFRTWGAISGRTSNHKPNLQNIKDKEHEGINLRALFIAPPGRTLVVADYSQIQLVIIAAMTKDPVMLDVITNGFNQGIDLHKMTACSVNAITMDQFNALDEKEAKLLRKKAKPVNFGLSFGMGAPSLIDYALMNYDVHFTLAEARTARARFFDTYKNVFDWHNEVKNSLYKGFYHCETLFGRKSCTTNFTEATNLPVQGMEADIMKMAMVLVNQAMIREGLKSHGAIVNMVHDELVAEVDEEYAEQLKTLMVREMELAGNRLLKGVVPVRVEANIALSWSDGK